MEPLQTGKRVTENAVPVGRLYIVLKRAFDIVFSGIMLIALSPAFVCISLVILIDSPGAGPFFTQERVGKDGRRFKFYKFRSMVPCADEQLAALLKHNEMSGPPFKIKGDPRITRVGRFMRKASIDELPQLLNVLKGDMSIVGPRPPLPREVAQYNDYQSQRLSVTPGLTCYWQIQPYRNDIGFDQWLELDLKYIRERSVSVDFRIILATFRAVWGMYGI